MLTESSPLPLVGGLLTLMAVLSLALFSILNMDQSDKISDRQIEMIKQNADFKVENNPNIVEDMQLLKSTHVTEAESKDMLARTIDAKSAEIAAANLKENTKTADAVSESKADKLKALDDEYAKKRSAIEADK